MLFKFWIKKHKAVYHLEKAVQNTIHDYSEEDVTQKKHQSLHITI
jgi:hypothetical protein